MAKRDMIISIAPQPAPEVTVTCPCGAVATITANSLAGVRSLSAGFFEAHKDHQCASKKHS